MNTSEQIIAVLDHLGEKLGIAIDWTTENIMPYLEQLFKRYATLKITYSSIEIFVGVSLCITAITLCVKLCKGYKTTITTEKDTLFWCTYVHWGSRETEMECFGYIATVVAIMSAIGGIIALCVGVHNLIEWIIVPEVPFVREIMSLINSGTVA